MRKSKINSSDKKVKKMSLSQIIKKMRYLLFIFFLVIVSTGSAQEQTFSTGLTFATQEELTGIPMASTPYSGSELPKVIDLSPHLPTPGHQGKQSSCTAWAVGYALKAYQEYLETNSRVYFSPSFIYNQINNGRDGGSRVMDALNLVSQQGNCTWDDMPYNENDYNSQPSQLARTKAKKYRIDYWRQVNIRDSKEIKAQINAGYPIVIGAVIDEGFERIKAYNEQSIWKQRIGATKGGHALLIVGYDDYKNAFKIINSWGTNWGQNGYGWIDYNLFPLVVREGYVAKDARNGEPAEEPNIQPNIEPINPVTPTQDLYVTFYNTNVIHNETNTTYGPGIRIDGYLNIPAGKGNTYIIVSHFYLSNSTIPVGSTVSPLYADINGNAATGTQAYQVGKGVNNSWSVFFPYNAFNINSGYYWGNQYFQQTTYMYAIPTLFIDGFGVAKGEPINFYVNR
jgi:hypothetical protein